MKRYNILALFIVAISIFFVSCDKDEFPVPEASSQAKFSVIQSVVEVENELGDTINVFRLELINESIFSTGYNWKIFKVKGSSQLTDTLLFESNEENPIAILREDGDYIVSLSITTNVDVIYNKLEDTKALRLLFKETLWLETFDGPDDGDDDEWLPEGWFAVDYDGDGLNWYWSPGSGNGQMRSQSYDGVPLLVDNWLITREYDLTNVGDFEIILSFNARPTANTAEYKQEHYGIFVSTQGPNVSNFIEDPLFTEKFTTTTPNNEFQYREVDLSEFVGQKIRIAIRHYLSSDNDRIVIDNVEVFKKF